MIIAMPPAPLADRLSSLHKHEEVVSRVYDPARDCLLSVQKVPQEFLLLAHDHDHVAKVLAGETPNGFHDTDPAKLTYALQSVNALVVAAWAAESRGVAFAPVSGFHHAGYRTCAGYCTFNGLVIVAQLRHELRTLILDGDGHYGDGTQEIIDRLDLSDHVTNYTMTASVSDDKITRLLRQTRADLVIYQAGADAHKADPYGVGYLDDHAWTLRDESVFRACKRRGVPVVWCMAGGYAGEKTISLHTRTFETARRIFE